MTAGGLAVALLAVIIGCSSIHIESGNTPEERTAVSERQARDSKATWAHDFSLASDITKADLLKTHIDSTSERLFALAAQFASEWRKGNQGRGQVIAADEMQQVLDNTIAPQKPVLKAWEDNMEYGWEWVRDSSRFDQSVIDLYGKMVDGYYEAYSGVFYPQSDVETYEERNAQAQSSMRGLSSELERELRRYR